MAHSKVHRELPGRWLLDGEHDDRLGGQFERKPAAGERCAREGLWAAEDTLAVLTLGCRLHQAAWSQGYATEGTRALIRRAFRPTPEDILHFDTSYTPSGEVWDGYDIEYALDRSDWEQQAGPGER